METLFYKELIDSIQIVEIGGNSIILDIEGHSNMHKYISNVNICKMK